MLPQEQIDKLNELVSLIRQIQDSLAQGVGLLLQATKIIRELEAEQDDGA